MKDRDENKKRICSCEVCEGNPPKNPQNLISLSVVCPRAWNEARAVGKKED